MTTTLPAAPSAAEPPGVEAVQAFALQVSEELAAASSVALAVLGDRLGLYRAMLVAGPVTPPELAARTGCAERYVREWLANQAAGGWVHLDSDTGRYLLPAAHAAVVADESSPVFLLGSAQTTAALYAGLDRLTEAFRSGHGVPWSEQHEDLHEGAARFFRTACQPMLADWVRQLDGVAARLDDGGTVVDLGCGRGAAALSLAAAFPRARVVGVDTSPRCLDVARQAADAAALTDRVRFEEGRAEHWTGRADLVCLLDVLHDTGDPVAVARAARLGLRPGGRLLVVEPAAGDRVEDNLHAVGRAYYAASTAFCTAHALSEPGGWALGAQAGPARLAHVLQEAGFTQVRTVATTPFQLVLEAR